MSTSTSSSKPSTSPSTTALTTASSKPGIPGPYSHYSTETHNSNVSYMLNNFLLKSHKDINVHVRQNVNNITINLDGEDDPQKVVRLIQDNFPGNNSIHFNFKDIQNSTDFTSEEEAGDERDFSNRPIGRSELKPSLVYNQNTFASNKTGDKPKLFNVSRLAPGKYSLEWVDEADDVSNFANLVALSKDTKDKKVPEVSAKMKGSVSSSNKQRSMLSPSILQETKPSESSIDRFVEVIHKDNPELEIRKHT